MSPLRLRNLYIQRKSLGLHRIARREAYSPETVAGTTPALRNCIGR
ncbi:MAG TPA: hypothetical protein VK828_07105 [Terriglobales bacterium]|nr:hypothetical protein [Terriglobales bacterium]